ncbi:hypothetical protein F5Y14DRAFT_466147 [Nemania sp. NC0429]|nr:hypothetical protein F5Y14DRAFT_466147 [Nemania sp. NC0429]
MDHAGPSEEDQNQNSLQGGSSVAGPSRSSRGGRNQNSLQGGSNVAGPSGQSGSHQTNAPPDYGPTNLEFSPLYIPRYIDLLDPDANPLERKMLHLLLKREDDHVRLRPPLVWLRAESRSRKKITKFELEVLRVLMEGTNMQSFTTDVIRKFPFLRGNWKFSRPRGGVGPSQRISDDPHRVPPRARVARCHAPGWATYKNEIVRMHNEAVAEYIFS